MKSVLLDRKAWDMVLDISGNIAVCTEPYSISQDVACACRLFAGELWYQANKGVPYRSEILGHWPAMSLVKARLVEAAMTVKGVASAQVAIKSLDGRTVLGQVQFIDVTGASHSVNF